MRPVRYHQRQPRRVAHESACEPAVPCEHERSWLAAAFTAFTAPQPPEVRLENRPLADHATHARGEAVPVSLHREPLPFSKKNRQELVAEAARIHVSCARIHMPEFPRHTLAALHGLVCCARSPRASHEDGGSNTSSSLRGGRCDGSSTKLGLALTPDYCCDERQTPEDCCGSQPQSAAMIRTIAW